MVTTVLETKDEWDAAARFTALGDTDAMLSNTGGSTKRFLTTMSDDIPVTPVAHAHPLSARERAPMQLLDGERLWVAGDVGTAAVEE